MSLRDGAGALDDVDDLVDHDGDAALAGGVDDDHQVLVLALGDRAEVPVEAQQRQDRAAVLHDLAVADVLDAPPRAGARAGSPTTAGSPPGVRRPHRRPARGPRRYRSRRSSSPRRPAGRATSAVSARRASACTSRISATRPSPRIVAPEYVPMRLQPGGERLDDDLLGAEHAVDDQAEALALGLQHRDEHVAVGALGLDAQHVGEAHQRQQRAAQPVAPARRRRPRSRCRRGRRRARPARAG